MFCEENSIVLSTTNYLKQDYSKTKHICFYGEQALHCILWSHIPTVSTIRIFIQVNSHLIDNIGLINLAVACNFVKKLIYLQCSNNSFSVSCVLVFTKYSRHAKI